MKTQGKALKYFLGSNTPQGFVSRFDQLADPEDGWRLFVIKGGPGSGKSTLLRRVANYILERGHDIELIHCSSDVDSLDGIICQELKISFADGMPPHTIEPKYPGAFESLIDITSCWDTGKLRPNREEIISLVKECSRYHEHCCRYLGAAASLLGESRRIAADALDTNKLTGYCRRLAERELRPKSEKGIEHVRCLSAVTNKGVVSFANSAKELCKRLYLVNDEYGAVSRVLLQYMRTSALNAGHRVINCYCPLSPFEKLEHLFLPDAGIGFLTSNTFHNYSDNIEPYRIVNSYRFMDEAKLRENRKRLNFNRKAGAQMITQATQLLQDAKQTHDRLELFYMDATDFSKVEKLTEGVLRAI